MGKINLSMGPGGRKVTDLFLKEGIMTADALRGAVQIEFVVPLVQ